MQLKPNAQVAARVEELLREQLQERGLRVADLHPGYIAENMTCHIAPDSSLTYFWKHEAILRVVPELNHDAVLWRMFTADDTPL